VAPSPLLEPAHAPLNQSHRAQMVASKLGRQAEYLTSFIA
jgi:hypothetical protein